MGVVYAGIDRTTRSRVAIKVVQARSSTQPDALRRFLLEATAAATVAHPAIVRVLHVDVSEDGMLFQAQELVEGVTLQAAVEQGGAWEPGRAARLGPCSARRSRRHTHGGSSTATSSRRT